MTNDTRRTRHRRITPRQPQPGEVLWTLTKGTESRRAELRDHGSGELQIYVNDQFVSGRRYESRTLAILHGGPNFQTDARGRGHRQTSREARAAAIQTGEFAEACRGRVTCHREEVGATARDHAPALLNRQPE